MLGRVLWCVHPQSDPRNHHRGFCRAHGLRRLSIPSGVALLPPIVACSVSLSGGTRLVANIRGNWNLIGTPTTSAAVASGAVTGTLPTGTATGDLIVAVINYRGSATFATPAGWTLVGTQATNADLAATSGIAGIAFFWIQRGASAPALVWNRTAGDLGQVRIAAFRPPLPGNVSAGGECLPEHRGRSLELPSPRSPGSHRRSIIACWFSASLVPIRHMVGSRYRKHCHGLVDGARYKLPALTRALTARFTEPTPFRGRRPPPATRRPRYRSPARTPSPLSPSRIRRLKSRSRSRRPARRCLMPGLSSFKNWMRFYPAHRPSSRPRRYRRHVASALAAARRCCRWQRG